MKNLKTAAFIVVALLLATSLVGACAAPTRTPTPELTPTPTLSPTLTPIPAPAKPIKLRYGTSLGLVNEQTRADVAWVKWVEEKSGGRVKIDIYSGGTLITAEGAWDELLKGVADIARASSTFSPEFTISNKMMNWFYAIPDIKNAQLVYHELRTKFPELDAEWAGAKTMAYFGKASYHVITAKKAIRTLDDFKGLQIKVVARFIPLAKALGSVPSMIPMADTYVALQKGIVDGGISPLETLKSWRLAELTKYVTLLDMGQGIDPMRHFNWDSWKRLPADIQKVFEESKGVWDSLLFDATWKGEEEGMKFAKELGVEFIKLPPRDQARFYQLVGEAVKESVKEVDAAGKPGTKIYEEMLRLATKYGK